MRERARVTWREKCCVLLCYCLYQWLSARGRGSGAHVRTHAHTLSLTESHVSFLCRSVKNKTHRSSGIGGLTCESRLRPHTHKHTHTHTHAHTVKKDPGRCASMVTTMAFWEEKNILWLSIYILVLCCMCANEQPLSFSCVYVYKHICTTTLSLTVKVQKVHSCVSKVHSCVFCQWFG